METFLVRCLIPFCKPLRNMAWSWTSNPLALAGLSSILLKLWLIWMTSRVLFRWFSTAYGNNLPTKVHMADTTRSDWSISEPDVADWLIASRSVLIGWLLGARSETPEGQLFFDVLYVLWKRFITKNWKGLNSLQGLLFTHNVLRIGKEKTITCFYFRCVKFN